MTDRFSTITIRETKEIERMKIGSRLKPSIISVTEAQDELTISVKDNGVEISKSNIHKLFRIDENYSTAGTNNEKGTGLGLILCKEFVEKHGGRIWVESVEGKGSVYCDNSKETKITK